MEEPEIEVICVEQQTDETTSPHGHKNPYDEHLLVKHNGEEKKVPITNVRPAAYDYVGFTNTGRKLPDTINFNRVFIYDGELHTETPYGVGLIEMYNSEMHFINTQYRENDSEYPIVWERE